MSFYQSNKTSRFLHLTASEGCWKRWICNTLSLSVGIPTEITMHILEHLPTNEQHTISLSPCPTNGVPNKSFFRKMMTNHEKTLKPQIIHANSLYCFGCEFVLKQDVKMQGLAINANLESHFNKVLLVPVNHYDHVNGREMKIFHKCGDSKNKVCMFPYWNKQESTIFLIEGVNKCSSETMRDMGCVELAKNVIYRMGVSVKDGIYFENWLKCPRNKKKKKKKKEGEEEEKIENEVFHSISWHVFTNDLHSSVHKMRWFPIMRLLKKCETYEFDTS